MSFWSDSWKIAVVVATAGCGDGLVHDGPEVAPSLANVGAMHTEMVMIREAQGGVLATIPVIVTSDVSGSGDQTRNSAFRLNCRDCAESQAAFGYSEQAGVFIYTYDSEPLLRAGTKLGETPPIVHLTIDARTVMAAYRLIDPLEPGDPPYIVRLRDDPERLYTTTCANFLEATQGSTRTIPITKKLLAHWGVSLPLPVLGCSTSSRSLPPPPPAETVATHPPVASIVEVWSLNRGIGGGQRNYPYLVTQDERGTRRGFVLECGSETPTALRSLGVNVSDIRRTPASPQELDATGYGKQPSIRCRGAGADVLAISSTNASTTHFKFGDDRDMVRFACREAEAFWQTQVTSRMDVPYQALAHFSDFHQGGGGTRALNIGCQKVCPPPPRSLFDVRWQTSRLALLQATGPLARVDPIVLLGEGDAFHTAVRLVCTDCASLLELFGYDLSDTVIAARYATWDDLRSAEGLDRCVPILDVR